MPHEPKDLEIARLLVLAKQAEQNSYVPFSRSPNGVALLGTDGKTYTGCVVEISNFTSSICAAKVALVKAISEGTREFALIAISGTGVDVHYLCGDCRQSLAEFGLDLEVVSEIAPETSKPLRSLLPGAFILEPQEEMT